MRVKKQPMKITAETSIYWVENKNQWKWGRYSNFKRPNRPDVNADALNSDVQNENSANSKRDQESPKSITEGETQGTIASPLQDGFHINPVDSGVSIDGKSFKISVVKPHDPAKTDKLKERMKSQVWELVNTGAMGSLFFRQPLNEAGAIPVSDTQPDPPSWVLWHPSLYTCIQVRRSCCAIQTSFTSGPLPRNIPACRYSQSDIVHPMKRIWREDSNSEYSLNTYNGTEGMVWERSPLISRPRDWHSLSDESAYDETGNAEENERNRTERDRGCFLLRQWIHARGMTSVLHQNAPWTFLSIRDWKCPRIQNAKWPRLHVIGNENSWTPNYRIFSHISDTSNQSTTAPLQHVRNRTGWLKKGKTRMRERIHAVNRHREESKMRSEDTRRRGEIRRKVQGHAERSEQGVWGKEKNDIMKKGSGIAYGFSSGFHRRIHKNMNAIALFRGSDRFREILCTQRLAERIDPNFSVDRIVFTLKDFVHLMNPELPKGSVIVFDDAGLGINSREWQSLPSKIF